ncbi:MAG: hypothetical protein H5T34_01635 [Candidatus Methanomethyliales bacterium]|nr:hypothetical protein [Candidatus Methanomethylicales archaeon]
MGTETEKETKRKRKPKPKREGRRRRLLKEKILVALDSLQGRAHFEEVCGALGGCSAAAVRKALSSLESERKVISFP